MLYVDWFVRRLNKTFHVVVKEDEVSFEAYDFYHEELDDLLIPLEHLEKLPNPLLFETLMYVDESRNEWIAGVVLDKETKDMMYGVWIITCKNVNRDTGFMLRILTLFAR